MIFDRFITIYGKIKIALLNKHPYGEIFHSLSTKISNTKRSTYQKYLSSGNATIKDHSLPTPPRGRVKLDNSNKI